MSNPKTMYDYTLFIIMTDGENIRVDLKDRQYALNKLPEHLGLGGNQFIILPSARGDTYINIDQIVRIEVECKEKEAYEYVY